MNRNVQSYDIAVIGSGFSGSLIAMIAAKLGRSVVLIERGRHPRFAIGESSTPLSNLLLEEIAKRYELPGLHALTKWGSWQEQYPEIACGLKRGFSFFFHDIANRQHQSARLQEQILVAASPRDRIADTHWFRADFDALLVRQAQQIGVIYQDQVELERLREQQDAVELAGTRDGSACTFRAHFVIDATGPRGCLHRLLQLDEHPLAGYPATQAVYSHFTGVGRLADGSGTAASYPIDDAAVHHVFNGRWVRVLQFNNGVTSAGIAATDVVAEDLSLADGAPAWRRVTECIPQLRRQFAHAVPVRGFTHMPKLSYRSAQVAGRRWALLPSAAGFVDPILSTGFPLALLGVLRVAESIERCWGTQGFASALAAYAAETDAELLRTTMLISALYANMNNFAAFRAILLIYFVAASYAETVRRLGKPGLAPTFLLHDVLPFGPATAHLLTRASCAIPAAETEGFVSEVRAALEPFDLAGLTKVRDGNDYPCEAKDLLTSAWKVGVSPQEVTSMLERSGFAQ